MANGGFKVIEDLVLEELVNGGSVTEICWGMSSHSWYDYKGITVAGDQEVWFDGDWAAISAVPEAQPIAQVPKFGSIKTTTGRLFSINDTTFRAD